MFYHYRGHPLGQGGISHTHNNDAIFDKIDKRMNKYLGNHSKSPKGEYLYDISTFEFSNSLCENYGLRIKIRMGV